MITRQPTDGENMILIVAKHNRGYAHKRLGAAAMYRLSQRGLIAPVVGTNKEVWSLTVAGIEATIGESLDLLWASGD